MTKQAGQAPTVVSLLAPEDSKRVADALIEVIQAADLDFASGVSSAFGDILKPYTGGWKEDWFPESVVAMCEKITRGVVDAAYQAAERRR